MIYGSVCSDIEAASVASKKCTRCKSNKTVGDYHKSSKSSDGLASWCKPCVNNIRRENRTRTYTAENKRKWAIKTRYGITTDQVESMFSAQKGACALCESPLKKFHIDHDHNNGVVRGLLCHRCNIRLGGWDDLAWRERAIRYMGIAP